MYIPTVIVIAEAGSMTVVMAMELTSSKQVAPIMSETGLEVKLKELEN